MVYIPKSGCVHIPIEIELIRMHLLQAALAAIAAFSTPSLAAPSTTPNAEAAFTYNRTTFLLHGEPFVMVGGQMDPQRIPPEYWRDRLVSAKAMGINTIFSYTFWNELEPHRGQWTGQQPANNIARFVEIVKEEGLYFVLRPGPYVCGEREWGGFPYWLSREPGLVPRSNNGPYLDATKRYLSKLADDLKHLSVARGGNLLMVQVENEYGSYGEDMAYKLAMRDMTRALFDVPLYTTDGGAKAYLEGGYIPGVLAVTDGGPDGFAIRDSTITDETSLGPQIDGEAYVVKSDSWGPTAPHYTTVDHPELVKAYIQNLNTTLSANNSFSYYMLHGGTNFGFSTGALFNGNRTAPWTNSYDHGAPIDEAGRTNDLYFSLREEILKYLPDRSKVPEAPKNIPLMSVPEITLRPFTSLKDTLACNKKRTDPMPMETFDQAYGFILYQHQVKAAVNGVLQPGDRPRDRVLVFVNGQRQGVIDSFYVKPATVELSLKVGDTLQLLVENNGRTNYWYKKSNVPNLLLDPYKGINGSVSVGGAVLQNWAISPLPYEKPPTEKGHSIKEDEIKAGSLPVFYSGSFVANKLNRGESRAKLDTYLSVKGGTRGVVWVNGFNLGRYWVVGPQQSLYLPGTILRPGASNDVVVLELEPTKGKMTAKGETTRVWGNNPDPDAP